MSWPARSGGLPCGSARRPDRRRGIAIHGTGSAVRRRPGHFPERRDQRCERTPRPRWHRVRGDRPDGGRAVDPLQLLSARSGIVESPLPVDERPDLRSRPVTHVYRSAARADHRARRLALHPGTDGVFLDPRVFPTAWSCASTMRSSPPTIARSETDFGADKVTSRPGPCWNSPSRPRRPICGPSGTLPSRIQRNVPESTGPERESTSAPLPAQPRLPVRGVVLGVVSVTLVGAGALRRRRDDTNRRYHRAGAATVR